MTDSVRKTDNFIKVEQLTPVSAGHNLKVKVVSVEVVTERVRTDGTHLRIAECLVGDDTGCVVLTARNSQIDTLLPGVTVIIRNAKVDMFQGFMRLSVDKWGSIKRSSEPALWEVDPENNLSRVEYELVSVVAQGGDAS